MYPFSECKTIPPIYPLQTSISASGSCPATRHPYRSFSAAPRSVGRARSALARLVADLLQRCWAGAFPLWGTMPPDLYARQKHYCCRPRCSRNYKRAGSLLVGSLRGICCCCARSFFLLGRCSWFLFFSFSSLSSRCVVFCFLPLFSSFL
ncbi:hypothetical protein PICMEDRAFT_123735 [Pichia membranifaciens NRRL Y-2026]|uniref:Uncharacterized protein n=1 Tax=Pichia membranifaciens NRRL Y-2026 TaxID=763406 RepID=A0A1E3NQ07_9ASCO|nr:hypothetical protein PICMEDRAFT_123735 [Pichia membranifaciens NRRL Y-2026]ODQ48132.1 hypothetical protein PICMEDRAFT_123735 [Pichia membranifaciens NRRL Y-2026]